ncbi:thiamine ABC transporter substrate binding subunit [Devosia sp.]|uniref:thiamine ABC transporter substrate binding subunit n=1 Tax=Devosia sp. TaxID=1871048 RepID=UPI003A8F572B
MRSVMHFALAALLGASALPAIAQDKPVLNVYAYESFATEWGPGPAIAEGFEAACDCTLEFTTSADAISTLRKLQLEGKTTTADVVIGLDTATAGEARATGLFAPHGLDFPDLALPETWDDPEFVPFDYGFFAFVYDKDRLETPPTSFEALIAEPDDFKIVIQDPRSSTPGLGLVMWIAAAYGDRAPEIWEGLKPHVLTVTRGWSESYSLFLDGQADMVLSYTTSPAYHAVDEDDDSYAYAPFEEGFVPQIEVAGLVASSDQQELGKQFLAYLMTPEAQSVIPTTNWMYPVIDLGDALPDAFAGAPDNVIAIDEDTIASESRGWVDDAITALQ